MKVRIRSTKIGKVRFTSHRDAARIWERALRIAELPIASTEGFTPRPKISFGLALPTGAESIAEYTDIEFRTDVDTDSLVPRLSQALPNGFDAIVAAALDKGTSSLQQAVTSCTWELWSPLLDAADHRRACRLLGSTELALERERKGKVSTDDVRPMILDLRPAPAGDRLVADLATIGRALRPAELASLAFPDTNPLDVRARRTHQWIDADGERHEVLAQPTDVDLRALAVLA